MKLHQKIIATLLSVVVFLSSTGFAVHKHYCGQILKEVSLFDASTDCHPQEMKKLSKIDCTLHKSSCVIIEKKEGCCKDEVSYFSLKDNSKLQTINTPLKMGTVLLFSVFNELYNFSFHHIESKVSKTEYSESPPKIYTEGYILFSCLKLCD